MPQKQKLKSKKIMATKSRPKITSRSKKKSSKLPSLFGRKYARPLLFAGIFALIGVGTLLASFAAGPATGRLRNPVSNKCLDNFFARQANTNYISIYPCTNNNRAQKWTLAADGTVRTDMNFCLDVQGVGTTPQTPIWLWECYGGPAQIWRVEKVNGQQVLRNPNSGLCMQTQLAKTETHTSVWLAVCNGNPAQVWEVPSAIIGNPPTPPIGNPPNPPSPNPNPTPTPTPPPTNPPPAGAVDVKSSCRNTNSSRPNGTTIRSNFPNDANTGPQVSGINEARMRSSGRSGRWTITQSGTVIDGVYHYGNVYINAGANNVTIKNSIICGSGTLIIENRAQGLVVENSIVRGERGGASVDSNTGTPCQAAMGYGNYTIRRSEISGCNDGLKSGGSISITNNWFHDNYTNRFGSGAGTHNDTVQQSESSSPNFTFEGNAAYQDPCTSNRHFQMAPTTGTFSASNLRIRNNFFYGITGFNWDRGFTSPGGSISNNVFAGSANRGPFNHGSLYAGGSFGGISVTSNVFESGQAANKNSGGYTCAAT